MQYCVSSVVAEGSSKTPGGVAQLVIVTTLNFHIHLVALARPLTVDSERSG